MSVQTSKSKRHAPSQYIRRAKIAHWSLQLLPRAPYETRYTPEHSIIGFSFESQEGSHSFASDKKNDFRANANGLAWVPAGCDVFSQSEGGEYLKIVSKSVQLGKQKDEQHFSDFIDPVAIQSAFALRRALLSENCEDLLSCEYWLMEIESCVSRVLLAPNNYDRGSFWMTTRRLKMLDETIEERLGTQLTVCDLANELGVSAGFFSREFKRATGRSPYQYIVDKRLARARLMLCKSKQELSAIAFDCGFSSHSHMTSQFRQQYNTTPGRLSSHI